jgi:hypothetical protein
MNRKISIPLALLLAFAGCSTTKTTNPADYKGTQVILGSIGGAAGKSTTYYILENGQVYLQESAFGELKELKTLNKKNTTTVFDLVRSLELEKENINKPGNMTWFITLKQAGSNPVTVKWGDSGFTVPDKFTNAYKQIQLFIHQ